MQYRIVEKEDSCIEYHVQCRNNDNNPWFVIGIFSTLEEARILITKDNISRKKQKVIFYSEFED